MASKPETIPQIQYNLRPIRNYRNCSEVRIPVPRITSPVANRIASLKETEEEKEVKRKR
jgi:hypothetical protein